MKRFANKSFRAVAARQLSRSSRSTRAAGYIFSDGTRHFNSLVGKSCSLEKTVAVPISRRNVALRFMSGSSIVIENLESLGDSITTAVLLSWNKETGDPVKEDDVIAVVETDKVTMDIRAKQSGTFIEQLCADGAEITVGSPLYKIDTSATEMPINAESTHDNTPPSSESGDKHKRTTVEVPIMGESITTGMVSQWNFTTGDFVKVDDIVATIETDKVNVDVRSTSSGTIVERFCEEGDEVEVGAPMFVVEEGESLSPPNKDTAPSKSQAPVVSSAPTPSEKPVPAAPPAPPTPQVQKAHAPVLVAPVVQSERSETRVKMTRMRMRIAQRLKEAQNTAAMLTTFQEVDMGYLMDMRKKHKDDFEKVHSVKLGFMSAFVRAATTALEELPAVNAVIDDDTNEIVYRNYVDISVAVASPTGLVVPVLRNCNKMGFADVEKSIGMYAEKAKNGTLALEDMVGGTFTISNGGVFGSLFGTPIINPPQSAILGMHATKMRPVVMPNGEIKARPMMYLALTYDHRLVDGREAVTFLKTIQSKIEDPTKLLLNI